MDQIKVAHSKHFLNYFHYTLLNLDIDIDLFKPGSDYLTTLPNNIISDFKDFCDRFKMNSGDREQLADLIKKVKEDNNI